MKDYSTPIFSNFLFDNAALCSCAAWDDQVWSDPIIHP